MVSAVFHSPLDTTPVPLPTKATEPTRTTLAATASKSTKAAPSDGAPAVAHAVRLARACGSRCCRR